MIRRILLSSALLAIAFEVQAQQPVAPKPTPKAAVATKSPGDKANPVRRAKKRYMRTDVQAQEMMLQAMPRGPVPWSPSGYAGLGAYGDHLPGQLPH